MNRFAVAGLGNIYKRHKNAIEKIGGKIIASYDPDPSRSPTVDSYEKLLQSEAEWVVILSPNKYHFPQVNAALAANKKVIVEKPAAMGFFDVSQYDRSAPLYTVSQLRYMDSILELRRQFQTGPQKQNKIVLDIKAHRPPNVLSGWRGKFDWSGGICYILGIHYFDILTWIFGPLRKIDYIRWISDIKVQGYMSLEFAHVLFNLEITETEKNKKILTVNKEKIDLAWRFFELHEKVYEGIIEGKGLRPYRCLEAFRIIEHINMHRTKT